MGTSGGPAGNGPSTANQVITLTDAGTNALSTTVVTYSLSNQQFGPGAVEGIPTNYAVNFGGASGTTNTAMGTFALYSLMNGISSPTNGLFTSCNACPVGTGINVTTDRSISLFNTTDALINSATDLLYPLNSRIYYGDLTISFNRPVSNPLLQFVGMGGTVSYTAASGKIYDMGFATEFDLVGTDVTLVKLSGNPYLNVTSTQVTNSSTYIGASSVGTATNGVTRYAGTGSVVAQGTNITSITLKMYVRGDGGRVSNGTSVVAPDVVSGVTYTPIWSRGATNPYGLSAGNISGDVMLFGVSLQRPVNVSGTIFNDPDGGNVNNSSGLPNAVPTGLYANLVDDNGNVLASTPVNADGTYTFIEISEGTYSVSLSTTAGTQGLPKPAESLPAGWSNTGEFNGPPNTGTDASVDGISNIFTVASTDVPNINFGIYQCPFTASTTGTNVICNGGTDGSASATPIGNIGTVTYLWDNGATTATITNLASGTYTVTLTDPATCRVIVSYTVTEPATLNVSCSKTDATTIGGNQGTATGTATGGTAPYTYDWSDDGAESPDDDSVTAIGLIAGSYTVTVTDSNGCTATCTTTVLDPICALSASANGTNISCNGSNDGYITAVATGNYSPVTYLWDNGATTALITSLTLGTYTVTITEVPTCTAIASYTIVEPSVLDISCTKTDASTIGGNQGTATGAATGGTTPYTYDWNNDGPESPDDDNATITGLVSSLYTVTVTDNNGCTATCSTTVMEPSCGLSVTANGTDVSCNGGSNGAVSTAISGNYSGVTYLWSNGETTADINGLIVGTYIVTVTEAPTCFVTATYTVTQPTTLSITCSGTNATVYGGNDGTASVAAVGGTSPYTYDWSNDGADAPDDDTANITGLSANTYIVTVTDANGCSASCNRIINQPPPPLPDLSLNQTLTTPASGIAAIGNNVTLTLTVTNDNGIDATGVVVTASLPPGVTFVSTTPNIGIVYSNGVITWTIGDFLGTDLPKTIDIIVSVNPVANDTTTGEGSHIITSEIVTTSQGDDDSTPGNNITGEDDIDQTCFSVPTMLCSDSPTANVTITADVATTYQWYVSTDNGVTYTALSGETNQSLVVNNTLMGGNNITKYFKVAYDGAAITDACGYTMCCPIVITTQTCIVCPAPKCIPFAVRKKATP